MAKKKNKDSSLTKEPDKLYAVIRVRGLNNCWRSIKDTLDLMNLRKSHNLTFVKNTPSYNGMLKKSKDWVTWGETNLEMVTHVLTRWGRIPGKKPLSNEYVRENTQGKYRTINGFAKAFIELKVGLKDLDGLKPFFRLHAPRKGHERGGIKKPYNLGGALGYRGDKINDLIKKMA